MTNTTTARRIEVLRSAANPRRWDLLDFETRAVLATAATRKAAIAAARWDAAAKVWSVK